jgi:hypothetical protein
MDIEIQKEFAAVAIDYYGATQARGGSGKKQVYGFEYDGLDYWFDRKQDAIVAAEWIKANNWDGMGDLEMILLGEGHEIGKFYG